MRLSDHWLTRYVLAVAAALLAVILREALEPLIGASVAFITVFPAIMVVAVTLGAGPGLVCTTLGIALIEWHYVGPPGIDLDRSFVSRAGILLATSAYVGWVSTRLRAARAQAAREAATAQTAEATLRQQVALIDPARAEIIAREMQRLLLEHARADAPVAAATGNWLRHIPGVTGTAVACLGGAVLLGWFFDADALKRVLPGLATMKANTALCFLLSGLALRLRRRSAPRMPEREGVPLHPAKGAERLRVPDLHPANGAERLRVPDRLSLLCAGLVCLVAGLTLAEYTFGFDFGLDQLMFRDAPDAHTIYPGRMVSVTALCFLMSAMALLLPTARGSRWLQQTLALATGLFGLTGLLGYLYEVQQLYRFSGGSSMALHTAAGFMMLSTGLLFARQDGLTGVLSGTGPGSQLARRILPSAIVLPVLLGWLHEVGERNGLWAAPEGVGLLILMILISLLAVVWWIAQELNRADAARHETEMQLRHQSELMNHADEALIVRELGGVIRFWNQGAAAQYGWSAAEALGQRTHVLLRTEGAEVEEKDEHLQRTGHWEGELTHLTRDGRRVFVESRQTATHAGGHVLILESDRDITARKQAEAERQMFVSLADQSTEFIGICDMQFQPFYVNAAGLKLVGLETLEQACRTPVAEFFFPEDQRRITEEFFPRVLREGRAEVEIRFRHFKTGATLWMIYNVFFLNDACGKPVGLATVSRNITDRKQADEALRASNAELSRFNDAAVGRELRIIALKQKINDLCVRSGRPQRYDLTFTEDQP